MTEQEAAVSEPGQLALDTVSGRVGRVMDHCMGSVYLRPLQGGRAWRRQPEHARRPTEAEALAAKVAAENARSERHRELR